MESITHSLNRITRQEQPPMELLGYKKDMILSKYGYNFDCLACQFFCKNPQECHGCGGLYCFNCIINLQNTIGYKECLRCGKQEFNPINEKLKPIYNQTQIQCICTELFHLHEYEEHFKKCTHNLPNCLNFEECQKRQSTYFQQDQVCSPECYILKRMKDKDKNQRFEQLKECIKYLREYNQEDQKIKIIIPQVVFIPEIADPLLLEALEFYWDNVSIGKGIILMGSQQTASSFDNKFDFRSVVSNRPFTSGRHYWEVQIDPRSESEIKIGVTVKPDFDKNKSFCDFYEGFGFYTIGELRHKSSGDGPKYACRIRQGWTLGLYLDMNLGTLSYSVNGKSNGVAFTHDLLKNESTVYPAIAFIHNSAITLKTNLEIPDIFL